MLQMNKVNRGVEGPHSINQGLPPSRDYWSPGIQASWPGWTTSRRAKPMSTPGSTDVEGAGGTGGPGCGARGRWRGLAGLRDDAPSEARGADGSRAGRRPRAHQAARPTGAPSSPAPRPAPQKGPTAPGTLVGPLVDARIQAERPASSVARWTPPRSASWAAWVRQEKPSARYTASGCADRDGSSEWDATATDRS